MQITRDFNLTFDPEAFIEFHGEGYERLLERPSVRTQFEEAFAEIAELVEPAACYQEFRIEKYLHNIVQLEGGVRFGSGPVVEVMGGSDRLKVAVCTVGTNVDVRLTEAKSDRKRFKALILDELGSWAVDQVRQELCAQWEATATEDGLHTSAMLSPGESTWSIDDQQFIFKLLDAEAIGVSLTSGLVMRPFKSLSLIMGISPEPVATGGLTNCDFCTIKDRCQYSRSGGHEMALKTM